MNEKTRNIVTENQKLLRGRQAIGETITGTPPRPAPVPPPMPAVKFPAALLPILQAAEDMGKLPELLKSLANHRPSPEQADMIEFARSF